MKEREFQVEEARADELTRQAQWERAKSKLKKLEQAVKPREREVHGQRVLTLLERAVSIMEELKTKLAQAEKDPQPGAPIRDEIRTLIGQLRALIDDAQQEDAAAQWAKLKPKVHAAAVRFLAGEAK